MKCSSSRGPTEAPALTYFIFDTELNIVTAAPGARWPVAVLTELRAHVRSALHDGCSSFTPYGSGAPWHIVPFQGDGRTCIAVYTDQPA